MEASDGEEDKMCEKMEMGEGDCGENEKRAIWNSELDKFLIETVARSGCHNWVDISDILNARFPDQRKSPKQCRERYCNKLNPIINHSPWTKQEEATLVLAHMQFKNRWCDISQMIPGRHNNMIKNRFYSIFRKVKNKIRNWEFDYGSKLELLEMYYIISVMEEYQSNPLPPDEPKRKRGRDFMYTLILEVKELRLEEYKTALHKKNPLHSPMKLQLQEIINSSNSQQAALAHIHRIQIPGETPHLFGISSFCPRMLSSSGTPNKLPGTALTLPVPHQATPMEVLTPDEKESFRINTFSSTPCPSSYSSSRNSFCTPQWSETYSAGNKLLPFSSGTRQQPNSGLGDFSKAIHPHLGNPQVPHSVLSPTPPSYGGFGSYINPNIQ